MTNEEQFEEFWQSHRLNPDWDRTVWKAWQARGKLDAKRIAELEALDTKQPTRLEVIDADGRTYTNWKVKDMEFSYQDDGRTLKIFIKGE